MPEIKLIAAVGKDGAIGKDGDLIWSIPSDLKRFKSLTMGHPIVMGRATWESLPKRPLPGRRNIVVTRRKDYPAEGAEIVNSPEEALLLTRNDDTFIIGGAAIYKAFLPHATQLILTEVEATCQDADAFLEFPPASEWRITEESPTEKTDEGVSYRYVTYQRVG
ncbi:MAG: dihydrofolate reductase [Muribaculaceae bacterium]|nr:dihydrofolate reductase [Muribaculaceae bacterium]